jgi:hypothetical protein
MMRVPGSRAGFLPIPLINWSRGKKRKSAAELVSWSVWKIAGKPKLLGQVAATSEDEAKRSFAELNIREEDWSMDHEPFFPTMV